MTEFDVPEEQRDESMAMTKYVEATTGANFEIACRYNATHVPLACDCIRLHITVDGKSVERSLVKTIRKRTGKAIVKGRISNISGSSVCEMFRFSRLGLSELPDSID